MFGDALHEGQVRLMHQLVELFMTALRFGATVSCDPAWCVQFIQLTMRRPCSILCHPSSLQCQALLDKLAATQLCFSCAHGRPTTVPVVDLRLMQQALRLQAEARAERGGGGTRAGEAGAANGGQAGRSGLKARLQVLVQ